MATVIPQRDATSNGHANLDASLLRSFDQIEEVAAEWALADRIPFGAFTRVVGAEGGAKTALQLRLAADWTRGRVPGVFEGTPINVAIFAPEDHSGSVLKPRFRVSGGNPTRMYELRSRATVRDRGLSLPNDAGRILDLLDTQAIKVLIIDPLVAILDPEKDSWKDADVREAFGGFLEEAGNRGITIMGTQHTNKGSSNDPRVKAIGTVGWRQLVRSSLYVGPDPDAPDDPMRRAVAHEKSNHGPLMPTLSLQLRTAPVDIGNQTKTYVYAELGDEIEGVTTSDIITIETSRGGSTKGSQTDMARMFLSAYLAEGPRPADEVITTAARLGVKKRTLDGAKKDLHVKAVKAGVSWTWSLPSHSDGPALD